MVNLKKRQKPRISVSTSGISISIYYPDEQMQSGDMPIDITQYPFSDAWKNFTDSIENTLSSPMVRASLGFTMDESSRKSTKKSKIKKFNNEDYYMITDDGRRFEGELIGGLESDGIPDEIGIIEHLEDGTDRIIGEYIDAEASVEEFEDKVREYVARHPKTSSTKKSTSASKQSFSDMIKSQRAKNYQDPKQMKKDMDVNNQYDDHYQEQGNSKFVVHKNLNGDSFYPDYYDTQEEFDNAVKLAQDRGYELSSIDKYDNGETHAYLSKFDW